MCFTITNKSTSKVICNIEDVSQALIAESEGFKVEAHGASDVLALATARIEDNPDYNVKPEDEDEWVKYKTNSGRHMICHCIRLFSPDSEGYPQLLELVSNLHPDSSFIGRAEQCTAFDLSSLPEELANAIRNGDSSTTESRLEAKPKITRGLKTR